MIKKILYFCMLFFFVPLIINAQDIELVGYEATINVSKNRTASIEEKMNLYIINRTDIFKKTFDKGINIYRSDNSKLYNDIIIDNITSNSLKSIDSNSKSKIVNLNVTAKKDTIQEINLKYNYNLGKDKAKEYDEFYYNIISNLDSIASDISFEIIFPKGTDIKNVEFAIDGKYNLSKDDVTCVIEDNIVTGYLNIMLEENQTFSVRVELPQGYFVNTSDNFNYLSYLYLIFPLATLIVILIYWFKFAKGNKVKRKYDYKPTNNFDPVEIGYLYKGLTEESDLITDLLYLANNGYLKIEENEDGYKLGKENSFKFIKLKEYEKNNAVQKLLFEGIFKNKDIVELKDIEYNYNSKIIDVKRMIDNKNNRLKLFNVDINKAKLVSMIMGAISIIILNIEPTKQLTGNILFVPLLSFIMCFGLSVLFILNTKGIFKIILGTLFTGGTIFISVSTIFNQTQLLMIYLLELLMIIISVILYVKLPLRTKYGNNYLGQVEGFKLALLNMNQKQLQELLNENPNYFYDMAPYASVLGILNDWMSKGKGIIKTRPEWHITKEEFDINKECRFFKNVIYTTSKVMIKAIYAKKESSQIEYKRDQINDKLNNKE